MAELETEVELLKKEVADMKLIHTRLDTAIVKITDVSNSIHRMLAVHEEKLNSQEEAVFAAEDLIEQIQKNYLLRVQDNTKNTQRQFRNYTMISTKELVFLKNGGTFLLVVLL